MSTKTIAVLDHADLKDGQMYGPSNRAALTSVTAPQEGSPV